MKKILILFFTLFSLNFSAAKVLQWRLLEVAPGVIDGEDDYPKDPNYHGEKEKVILQY